MINAFGFFILTFAFLFIVVGFIGLKKLPEGPDVDSLRIANEDDELKKTMLMINSSMRKLAGIIRGGARTFVKIQFQTIALVAVIVCVLFSLFLEVWSGPAFILGAAMSSISVIVGMTVSTLANVRVAEAARRTGSTGKTVKAALSGGKIIGICVQFCGTLGILILYLVNPLNFEESGHGIFNVLLCNASVMRFTSYALGCSLVAMFCRIAGGIFTKAADMAADIVGKVLFGYDEDDARNPATVADFVGDNVADVGANCPDLLESYVATIVSSLASAVYFCSGNANPALFDAMTKFPILLSICGLLASMIGLFVVIKKPKMSEDPGKELDVVTYVSAGIVLIFSFVGAYFVFGKIALPSDFRFGWASLSIVAVIGIASGVLISRITEYFTSEKYKATKELTKASWLGPAFLITMVDALGSKSGISAIVLIVSVQAASYVCGSYGIAIAALGMLSFIGATVSIDAFGPISDNAGGIVESCGLSESVRVTTDRCDAAGNTTAAIAKGFAIGGAAYAAISMNATFASAYGANLSLLDPAVVGGGILGAVAIKFFIGLLDEYTYGGAKFMASDAIRQLEDPDIRDQKKEPDYDIGIERTTKYAKKKMAFPALLCILAVIGLGILCGGEEVGGILYGMTLVAIVEAIFLGNSGGAADNNKKYIESGDFAKRQADILLKSGEDNIREFLCDIDVEDSASDMAHLVRSRCDLIYGKGSEIHKTSVVGDTVGDPRKDVDGVSLDIFIKMSSTAAVIFAPMFRVLSGNWVAKGIVLGALVISIFALYFISKKKASDPQVLKEEATDIIRYNKLVCKLEEEKHAV